MIYACEVCQISCDDKEEDSVGRKIIKWLGRQGNCFHPVCSLLCLGTVKCIDWKGTSCER